jgi:hypothetical protein
MVVDLCAVRLYQVNDEAAAFADSSIPLGLYEHRSDPEATKG